MVSHQWRRFAFFSKEVVKDDNGEKWAGLQVLICLFVFLFVALFVRLCLCSVACLVSLVSLFHVHLFVLVSLSLCFLVLYLQVCFFLTGKHLPGYRHNMYRQWPWEAPYWRQ